MYLGLSSGLVGWWTFDGNDTGTTSVLDRSGNGTLGYFRNGTQKVIGKIGQGIKFDGVIGGVDLGTSAVLDLRNSVSVSAWYFATATPPSGHIFDIYAAGAAAGVGVENYLSVSYNFGESLVQWCLGGSASCEEYQYTPTSKDGRWIHFAGTWDGVVRKLYMDGAFISQTSQSGTLSDLSNSASIGFQSFDVQNEFCGCLIDDVRVYNRGLTADEVKRLYNMGR